MNQMLSDIRERSSYAKYDKWGLYNWGMIDVIQSSIPNEIIFDYYEWRTKIRRVIVDIKFGPPGITRFQIRRFQQFI